MLECGETPHLQLDEASSLVTWTPTDEQIIEVEREQMASALKPFHDPKLRDAILAANVRWNKSLTSKPPTDCSDGFDAQALEKARAMLTSFKSSSKTTRMRLKLFRSCTAFPIALG